MNSVLGKLNILILIVVMAVLPLQSNFAGLPSCPETTNTTISHQHHEHGSSATQQQTMMLAVNQNKVEDCCNKNHCVSMQCTSLVMMTLGKFDASNITYIASNSASSFSKAFIKYLNTSIYRPPIS